MRGSLTNAPSTSCLEKLSLSLCLEDTCGSLTNIQPNPIGSARTVACGTGQTSAPAGYRRCVVLEKLRGFQILGGRSGWWCGSVVVRSKGMLSSAARHPIFGQPTSSQSEWEFIAFGSRKNNSKTAADCAMSVADERPLPNGMEHCGRCRGKRHGIGLY
ncbi:hypothetical protein L207DRAFT_581953 [Hyaloscypha variabilis F]|uniref:Uncharacterized protein n=1 Tax=Hyaloscypha variabilis (strain UAMH 11265 / GT02V1 / F) TaxID=1149755 RepID=A0A2J6RSP8_HYAVF|nr:hypothetical protein L207DRAFT_581953 [Hyaloscypha variabilis F]